MRNSKKTIQKTGQWLSVGGNLLERGMRILLRVIELHLLYCDYITVNNYKISSVSILKMGEFFVCKLYTNKEKTKTKKKIIYKILGLKLTCFHFCISLLNFLSVFIHILCSYNYRIYVSLYFRNFYTQIILHISKQYS